MTDHDLHAGTSYGIKTRSAKRSSMLLRATQSEIPSTTRSSRQSWTSWSRSRWTRRCSRLEQCRCRIKSSESPPHLKTVSPAPRATKIPHLLTSWNSQGQDAGCAGGRRRGRAAEAASRDGHVRTHGWHREQTRCQEHITRAWPQTFWPSDRSRQEDCPEQLGKDIASGDPSATGVGVQETAFVIVRGIRGQEGGSQLYNFRTILNSLSSCSAHPCLTGRLQDYMWRIA